MGKSCRMWPEWRFAFDCRDRPAKVSGRSEGMNYFAPDADLLGASPWVQSRSIA